MLKEIRLAIRLLLDYIAGVFLVGTGLTILFSILNVRLNIVTPSSRMSDLEGVPYILLMYGLGMILTPFLMVYMMRRQAKRDKQKRKRTNL